MSSIRGSSSHQPEPEKNDVWIKGRDIVIGFGEGEKRIEASTSNKTLKEKINILRYFHLLLDNYLENDHAKPLTTHTLENTRKVAQYATELYKSKGFISKIFMHILGFNKVCKNIASDIKKMEDRLQQSKESNKMLEEMIDQQKPEESLTRRPDISRKETPTSTEKSYEDMTIDIDEDEIDLTDSDNTLTDDIDEESDQQISTPPPKGKRGGLGYSVSSKYEREYQTEEQKLAAMTPAEQTQHKAAKRKEKRAAKESFQKQIESNKGKEGLWVSKVNPSARKTFEEMGIEDPDNPDR